MEKRGGLGAQNNTAYKKMTKRVKKKKKKTLWQRKNNGRFQERPLEAVIPLFPFVQITSSLCFKLGETEMCHEVQPIFQCLSGNSIIRSVAVTAGFVTVYRRRFFNMIYQS